MVLPQNDCSGLGYSWQLVLGVVFVKTVLEVQYASIINKEQDVMIAMVHLFVNTKKGRKIVKNVVEPRYVSTINVNLIVKNVEVVQYVNIKIISTGVRYAVHKAI